MEYKIQEFIKRLTLPYIITIFLFVGFIVFGNTLFNDFIEDDKLYIINNQLTHILSIPIWFGKNSFSDFGQYRAIHAAYFSILYSLLGTTPFFYHVLQIIFHVISAVLVYILFRKFIFKGVAFFLALVFLVHPINVESVSYISQTINPIFFSFGITSLLIFMKKDASDKNIIIASILLLLSLLSKETGALFLFLILIYSFFFIRKSLLKFSVATLAILSIYAFIRLFIGHIGLSTRLLIPIASLSLPERLAHIPIITLYYLKTFFFPQALLFNQQWTISSVNFSTFYFPLLIDLGFFVLVFIGGLKIAKHHEKELKPFLFFTIWFSLGLILHLQIFPLDRTVADRWFYFPIVGLLGLMGILCQNLVKKSSFHLQVSILLSIFIILSLSIRTIIRNNNWKNAITLYTHDMKLNSNYDTENTLGQEYLSIKEYDKALYHLQKSVKLRPFEYNLHNLGVAYEDTQNLQKAKEYYKKSLSAKDYKMFFPHKHDLNSYKSYSSMLVFFGSAYSTTTFINKALTDYPDSSDLWLLLALSEYKQNDTQGALNAAIKSYQLNPNPMSGSIYTKIKNREAFNVNAYGKTFNFSSK